MAKSGTVMFQPTIHTKETSWDDGSIDNGVTTSLDTSRTTVKRKLEDIALRWRVNSTSPWDAMYEMLCRYVKERKAVEPTTSWDGIVPVKYKTKDNPPMSLGTWVKSQRSDYGKGKLKKERLDQLNAIGLRWSVHERRSVVSIPSREIDDD
jgi:hypothetical protein